MPQSKRIVLVGLASIAAVLILISSYYWAHQAPSSFPAPQPSRIGLLGDTPTPAPTATPGDPFAPTLIPSPAATDPGAPPTDPATNPPAATDTPRPPFSERGPDGRYLSADLDKPQVIPDNEPVGALSHVIVPESFNVTYVQLLNLRVQHPDTGELLVVLRAPDGTTISPITGICPGAQNWKALSLDDSLPRVVGQACQNDLDDGFRPLQGQELAHFKGHPAQGTWTLQIVDNRPGNSGTLIGWSLLFTDTVPVRPTPTAPPVSGTSGTAPTAPQVERGPDGRYLSTDLSTPRAIPDNSTTGAISRITVPDKFNVTNVQLLNLRVTHPNTGDLLVTLRSPDGTTISPVKGICPGSRNWKALSLVDGLPRVVGEGCQNDLDDGFRPPTGQELARFKGHPAQGDWTLQVVDTRARNSGTLVGWSLLFTTTLPSRLTPTPTGKATPGGSSSAPLTSERGPDGRYLSADLDSPRSIPDNTAAGVTSHVIVPEKFNVTNVQLLNVRVLHPNTGDLVVTLRAPDGTTVTPINGICPGAHNWNALSLIDGLPRMVGEGCQDDLDDGFRPPTGQELARFKGHPAQGDWTLKVVDTRAGNSGTLVGWSLLFTTTLPSPIVPTPEGAAPPTDTGATPSGPTETPTPLSSERGPDGRYLSADLDSPRAIPDNDPNGVTSRVIVPESFNVTTVQLLNLRVQHPDTGDLLVTLRAPDGTTITPLQGVCAGSHNWNALSLIDGLPRMVGEGCQNDLDDGFRPPAGQELARFKGHPAQGDWTLKVVDTRPGNPGTLVGWSLLFTTTVPSPITPTPEVAPPAAESPTAEGGATATPSIERGSDGRYLSTDLDPPRAIPDNDPAGVTSRITVPYDFPVSGMQLLNLRVAHPDTGDLVVTLRAPDGTMITPINGICPGNHNWKALSLDDSFAHTVGEGCQDDIDDGFRPPAGQELSRFDGHSAQGDWILQVVDTRPGNTGTLDGWSLHFTIDLPSLLTTATPVPNTSSRMSPLLPISDAVACPVEAARLPAADRRATSWRGARPMLSTMIWRRN